MSKRQKPPPTIQMCEFPYCANEPKELIEARWLCREHARRHTELVEGAA